MTPSVAELFAKVLAWELVMEALAPDWKQLEEEYTSVDAAIRGRYRTVELQFPDFYAVETLTAKFLYILTRTKRPNLVLETGVANGHTTAVFLAAMERNGVGQLHSTDVNKDVGCLLTRRERQHWHYHCLPSKGRRRAFVSLLDNLPRIDLFFHDSDHRYRWQYFEYETGLRHLAPQGLMASDDVDSSYAFLDSCAAVGKLPVLVFDHRKLFGIAVSPASRSG